MQKLMPTRTSASALAAALALAVPSGLWAQQSAQQEDPLKNAVDGTVRVVAILDATHISQGTGWVIRGPDNRFGAGESVVVTAAHVLKNALKVYVVPPGASLDDVKPSEIKSSSISVERDIAFIEVKGLNARPLTVTRATPKLSEAITAIGYTSASDAREARGAKSSAAAKGGHYSKAFTGPMFDAAQAPVNQIEFDAQILPGYSGGPLVNTCGRVIGLTVKDGGHIDVAPNVSLSFSQGVNAGLAADEIIKAAHDAGITIDPADTACAPPPNIQHDIVPPPPSPSFWDQVLAGLRNPASLIGLGLAGIGLAGGGAWYILRGGKTAPPPPPPPASNGTTPITSDVTNINVNIGPGSGLRISGRGPANEVIDAMFAPDELRGNGVTLGRENTGKVLIPDKRSNQFVGRDHAKLTFDGRNYIVTDLNSKNKTHLNGRQLVPNTPNVLTNGDTLKLADVTLSVAIV